MNLPLFSRVCGWRLQRVGHPFGLFGLLALAASTTARAWPAGARERDAPEVSNIAPPVRCTVEPGRRTDMIRKNSICPWFDNTKEAARRG
ncbi:hypothetical protein FKV24_006140 [Lysobacter maris]|uniref:Uncharacterized protein n=1 Tax=Marilutibacter maris TaxID=1605891 RepID=A0A508AYH3_9GAMM|nr:hypothetical protein [Lysobacter maris]KAB8193916.1 hypothetical protein FKV24_006140 [Lysobacter maris]